MPGISHSQCGEDRICAFLFEAMRINRVRYIDIGCHDPVALNNTFAFYERGGEGIAIDANPLKAQQFKLARPRDTVVNAMVADQAHPGVPFYVLTPDTLSSGNAAEVERLVSDRAAVVQHVVQVPMVTPVQLVQQFLGGQAPELVSIDVEGVDEAIVRSFLASGLRPTVFVVETLEYVREGLGRKKTEFVALLEQHGYMLYADTYINSIFVHTDTFRTRFNSAAD